MASWVTKKVILDFLFLLRVENSTMAFPTMVKTKRTHRVINCSVCEKQSNTKLVYQWGPGYFTEWKAQALVLKCLPSGLLSPPVKALLSREQRHSGPYLYWQQCKLMQPLKRSIWKYMSRDKNVYTVFLPSNFKPMWKNSKFEKDHYNHKDVHIYCKKKLEIVER